MINNADCSLCVGQYEGCPPNKRLAITDHNGGRSQRHSCLDVNPPPKKSNNTNCGKNKQINIYWQICIYCARSFSSERRARKCWLTKWNNVSDVELQGGAFSWKFFLMKVGPAPNKHCFSSRPSSTTKVFFAGKYALSQNYPPKPRENYL